MKKILSMITLTVLMVALAGSCTKNIEERIDKTDAEVAALQTAIGQYEKLQQDINSVLQALRTEVGNRPASEQQSVWNCINTLQNQSNAIDAALKSLRQLVGETPVSSRIDEALENLVSEYNLDEFEATLQELKEKVNAKYDVTELEKKVAQLKSKVDNLITSILKISDVEYMIQSVSIAPAYSDGSVKADENGILTFKCIVSPAEAFALESNVKKCFKIKGLSVESLATKAASPFVDIPVRNVKVLDKAQGAYEITADANTFPVSGGNSLMICLNVKTGYSDFTTDFVKVTGPNKKEPIVIDGRSADEFLVDPLGGDETKTTKLLDGITSLSDQVDNIIDEEYYFANFLPKLEIVEAKLGEISHQIDATMKAVGTVTVQQQTIDLLEANNKRSEFVDIILAQNNDNNRLPTVDTILSKI